jgi:hypothetical protein
MGWPFTNVKRPIRSGVPCQGRGPSWTKSISVPSRGAVSSAHTRDDTSGAGLENGRWIALERSLNLERLLKTIGFG